MNDFIKYLVLIFGLFSGEICLGQTIISGLLKDEKGNAIAGANVYVVGNYDGATTDSLGTFSFETKDTGLKVLVMSVVGYKQVQDTIKLMPGQIIKMPVVVMKIATELSEVVINAGMFDPKKISILNSLDMVTAAGTNGDVGGAIKTLPGTQQINNKTGLFVRGGTGAETQLFMDGNLVRNGFMTGSPDMSTRFRFSPFIFKNTQFSTGGYSALYGQALSAAVIMESIDLPDKSVATLSLSPMGIGAGIQKLSKNKKFSWGADYNFSDLSFYFKWVKQNTEYALPPQTHAVDVNLRYKTSETGIIKLFGYASYSKIGSSIAHLDSWNDQTKAFTETETFDLKNPNVFLSIFYQEYLKNDWRITANIGHSFNNNKIAQGLQTLYTQHPIASFNFVTQSALTQSKLVLQKQLKRSNVFRVGMEEQYYNERYKSDTSKLHNLNNSILASFAELEQSLIVHMAMRIGLRAEYDSYLGRINMVPRASLSYRLNGIGQLNAAYGIYYQQPDAIYLGYKSPTGICTNLRATHYILNFEKSSYKYLFRIEGYYKKYLALVKDVYPVFPFYNQSGSGYAAGFDIYWRSKKIFKNWDYWTTYSFIDSKRNFLDYPKSVHPDFVTTHTVNMVIKRFFPKLGVGMGGTYTFASGRPYWNPNITNPLLFMSERTPAFHNLSAEVYHVCKFKNVFMVAVAGVTNIFGFRQIYGYRYASDTRDLNGELVCQPITPASTRSFFIGLTFSFGVDRSQEIIDNSL